MFLRADGSVVGTLQERALPARRFLPCVTLAPVAESPAAVRAAVEGMGPGVELRRLHRNTLFLTLRLTASPEQLEKQLLADRKVLPAPASETPEKSPEKSYQWSE